MPNIILLVILAVITIIALVVFLYMSLCFVVVKQGTRKIVERFGVYRKVLKEGVHFILRPFDRIAPVPWEVLSITDRDNLARSGYTVSANENHEVVAEATMADEENRRLIVEDLTDAWGKKVVDVAGEDSGLDKEAIAEINLAAAIKNSTGRDLDFIIDSIVMSKNRLGALDKTYKQLGLTPSQVLKEALTVNKQDYVGGIVKYYPKHQDPKRSKTYKHPQQENHILDYIDLRERYIDSEDHPEYRNVSIITKDNALVEVNTMVFFYITDCYMYYYGAKEPEQAMAMLTISILRNILASFTLEEALQGRLEINKRIREELDGATNTWGIKVSRVEIKSFEIGDPKLKEAMNQILISERAKRSTILEGEAKARYIELTRGAEAAGYKMIKESGIDSLILKVREYEALEKVADGKSTKIFLPNDMGGTVTGAHILADALADKKDEVSEAEKKAKQILEDAQRQAQEIIEAARTSSAE